MLISIIIPIYNVEEYLQDCIESVINQSYENLEILLINDGSTDFSGKICEEYLKKDDRVKVYHKENGGLSDARNFGIDRANGEYIYLLDSDDYLYNTESISLFVEEAVSNKADIVIGSYVEKIGNTINVVVNNDRLENLSSEEAISKIYQYKEYKGIFTVAHNKLYKKNLFEKILYPKGKIHEDEFTTYKLYLEARNIVYLGRNTYVYRIRKGSIMTSPYSFKKLDAIEALEERLQIFQELSNRDLIEKTYRSYIFLIEYNLVELLKNNYKDQYLQLFEKYKKISCDYIKSRNILLKIRMILKICKLNIKLILIKIRR